MPKRISLLLLLVSIVGFATSVNAITFFDIWEFRVEGVTRLEQSDVQRAVEPFLGQARSVNDVDKAAQAIQRLYQEAGMPTTGISAPDQNITDGSITLVVEETRLRRVPIEGSRYFSLDMIRDQFPSLQPGEILDISRLQQDARKANQLNSDLKVVPVLEPSPMPGAIDVHLNVADQLPLHGGVEVTNYHTETTSPLRFGADLRYGNLWQRNHEIGFQVQTTPENTEEMRVFAGSYLFPINKSGGKIAFYAVNTESDLAVTVSNINVLGDGNIVGFRWAQPVSMSAGAIHSFSVGADYKDFNEDIELGGDPDNTITTPVEYVSFSTQYNAFRRGDKTTDSFSTGFTFGSRLITNDAEEFAGKRRLGDTDFVLWKLNWERTYALFSDWTLTHALRGQFTRSPLVSNEQFSAGGVDSVRGYYESQAQGDSGWVVNVEFATPPFTGFSEYALNRASAFMFYDAAGLSVNDASPDQDDYFRLASTGLGMRALLFDNWQLKVEGGYPLKEKGSVEKGDFRARASLRMDF